MTDDIKEDVRNNVQKARRRRKRAADAVVDGDFDFAIADLYYACFYYLRALLLTRGTAYQTHKGALIGFGKLFVKEKRASDEMYRFLERLNTLRLDADYRAAEFTPAEVSVLTNQADAFIAFAENYLTPFLK